jgi:hypothetical protein
MAITGKCRVAARYQRPSAASVKFFRYENWTAGDLYRYPGTTVTDRSIKLS